MKSIHLWGALLLLLFTGLPMLVFSNNLPLAALEGETSIIFKGQVFDADVPLAYVNIGVMNHSVGTVSNENGTFSLEIGQELVNETIQFSFIGYESKRVLVRDVFQKGNGAHVIKLNKNEVALQEVVVSAKKMQKKVVGRKKTGGMFEATFNQSKQEASAKLGTEIGLKIKTPNTPVFLKDFHWYLSSNNFEKIKFRVNVYALKNNLPDSLILRDEIYVEVENAKTGWNVVDLEPYNITSNSDFAITLRWVNHEIKATKEPVIWIPGTLAPFQIVYLRDGSQDKWTTLKGSISYYVTYLY